MSNQQQRTCLGLITARGGSKGVPRKNVRQVAGKPLIAWTIEAAQQASLLTRIIVSTDDEEIASIARELGAEVPFTRPKELAQDTTPHLNVVLHALSWLAAQQQFSPEYVFTLQPTSPLRQPEDIDNLITLAYQHNADAAVTVSETHDHPNFVRTMDEEGILKEFFPCGINYPRRQDLPPAYVINGAGFVNKHVSLVNHKTFYPSPTYGYLMPVERSVQIDTPWDLHLAELILRERFATI